MLFFLYEKIVMRAGDDEQMVNYEWPNENINFSCKINNLGSL